MRTAWTRARLGALVRYAVAALLLNLAWEVAQMPLYTLWWTAPADSIAFAIIHCTAGDVLIALSSLLIPTALFGREWPVRRFLPVALTAVMLGLGYTAFSEWLNVYVRHSWAYSAWMPLLPLIGIGVAPLVQWVVLPSVAFAWMSRRAIRAPAVVSCRGLI